MIRLEGNKYISRDVVWSGKRPLRMVKDLREGKAARYLLDKVNVFHQSERKMMKFGRDLLAVRSGEGIANQGYLGRLMRNTLQYRSNYLRMASHGRKYSFMEKPDFVVRRPAYVYRKLKRLKVLPSKFRQFKARDGFVVKMMGLYKGVGNKVKEMKKVRNMAIFYNKSNIFKKMFGLMDNFSHSMRLINRKVRGLL